MTSEKAVAVQKATTIRAFLEGQKKQLALAVPKHLPVDRLLRVAMTSIQPKRSSFPDIGDISLLLGGLVRFNRYPHRLFIRMTISYSNTVSMKNSNTGQLKVIVGSLAEHTSFSSTRMAAIPLIT